MSGTGGPGTVSSKAKKDPAWEYAFQPDPNNRMKVGCKVCNNVYYGGISRVKYHLAGIGKKHVAACAVVSDDLRKKIYDLVTGKMNAKEEKANALKQKRDEVNLNRSEGSGSEEDDELVDVGLRSLGPIDKFCKATPEEARRRGPKVKLQTKLTAKLKKEKRERVCEYIAQWFYEASIPHNAITLPSFELMLEAIGDYGRGLRAPTRYELGGPLLKKRKQSVVNGLKLHKESWELTGCSVMTDGWTDIRGRGIMNLVVHSALGVCFLRSVDVSGEKKDGKFISELIDKCIEDIGEKNVVQVVTDNARPNESAGRLLIAKRPHLFWTGCAAHTIDLMLGDIGELPSVKKIISQARTITIFLYAHTRILELMRKFLGKDLVRSSVTRFATAYLNLKSIQDKMTEMKKLFRSDELYELGDYMKKAKGKTASKFVRSESFWNGLNDTINLFEPLVEVLRRVDGDIPAMGFLYGDLLDAKREIALRFEGNESKYKSVVDIIDKRWNAKLKTPLHKASYYLNPYYYYANKSDSEMKECIDGVVSCMASMYSEVVQDKITEELINYQDRKGSFGRDIAIRQRNKKNFYPAKWWDNHGASAPNLKELAKRILNLTCSSSACERNWSTFEQVHTKKRARLLHERLNDLVFVKFNSKLKEKKENKNRDPIECEGVDVLEDENNEWVRNIEVVLGHDGDVPPGGSDDVVMAGSSGARRMEATSSSSRPSKKNKRIVNLDDEEEFISSSSDEENEDVLMDGVSSSNE